MDKDPFVRMVRRIRVGEGQLFKQLRLASLHESPSAFSSTYESAQLRTAESWAEQADSTARGSDRSTFIAFSDELPIGIAALYRAEEGADTGLLLQVWVAPEYRSKGVAVDLLHALFQWARQNGFRAVVARVAKDNARALTLYRNYGFGPSQQPFPGGPAEAVILTKAVEAADAAAALAHDGDR